MTDASAKTTFADIARRNMRNPVAYAEIATLVVVVVGMLGFAPMSVSSGLAFTVLLAAATIGAAALVTVLVSRAKDPANVSARGIIGIAVTAVLPILGAVVVVVAFSGIRW